MFRPCVFLLDYVLQRKETNLEIAIMIVINTLGCKVSGKELGKWIATTFLMLLSVIAVSADAAVPKQAEAKAMTMIKAIQQNQYDRFVAAGTREFKAALSHSQFSGLVSALSGRLSGGYQQEYLTTLQQQGLNVYLWKLGFNDRGDDHLIKLVIQNDQVAGFWIQ